jgi:hypothetical protein
MQRTATGSFVVALQPLAFEGADDSMLLGRLRIDKTISGDLVASTCGQMLSAGTGTQGSAGYVAIERVTGSLHGRRGSFALQHSGTMDRGAPSLRISVVPDSGTDELLGLQGRLHIDRSGGQHAYSFEYTLPDAA